MSPSHPTTLNGADPPSEEWTFHPTVLTKRVLCQCPSVELRKDIATSYSGWDTYLGYQVRFRLRNKVPVGVVDFPRPSPRKQLLSCVT